MEEITERIRQELERQGRPAHPAAVAAAVGTFRQVCAGVLEEWGCPPAGVELLMLVVHSRRAVVNEAGERSYDRSLTSDKVKNFISEPATKVLFRIADDTNTRLRELHPDAPPTPDEVIRLLARFTAGIAPTQPGALRNRMATLYAVRLTAFTQRARWTEAELRAHVASLLRQGGLTAEADIARIWTRLGADRLRTLTDDDIRGMGPNYTAWDHVVRMYEPGADGATEQQTREVETLIRELARRVEAVTYGQTGREVEGEDFIRDELTWRIGRYVYLESLPSWLLTEADRRARECSRHVSLDDVTVGAEPPAGTGDEIAEEVRHSEWWHKLVRLTFSPRTRDRVDVLWQSFDDGAHGRPWTLEQLAVRMTAVPFLPVSEMAAVLLRRRYRQRICVVLRVMDEDREPPPSDAEVLAHLRTEFSPVAGEGAGLPASEVRHYRWLAAMARVVRHLGRSDWAVFAAYLVEGGLSVEAATAVAWPDGADHTHEYETTRERATAVLTDRPRMTALRTRLGNLNFWATPAALLHWVWLEPPRVVADTLAPPPPSEEWTRLRNAISPSPTDSEGRQ